MIVVLPLSERFNWNQLGCVVPLIMTNGSVGAALSNPVRWSLKVARRLYIMD